MLLFGVVSCQKADAPAGGRKPGGLTAVATIFPVYDFAKIVAGGKVDVTMLVPPGVETHEFEPRPADIVKVHNSDFFIYSGPIMEPWVGSLLAGIGSKGENVVNVGAGIKFTEGGGAGRASVDPHIWLDFSRALTMVDGITVAFSKKDPDNLNFYLKNSGALKSALVSLDERYAMSLKNCPKNIVVHGSHNSFGYLARRYGLRYEPTVDSFRDAEPSPARMAFLARLMRDNGLKYVLYDELDSPALANALAKETGAGLLGVNSAHTVAKVDFEKGITFMTVMEKNLEKFKTALECRN